MSSRIAPNIVDVAAGRIAFDGGGVPSFVADSMVGFSPTIVDNGDGDITLTIPQVLTASAMVFIGRNGALAASGLVAFGSVLTAGATSTTLRITMLNEGAAGVASALTNLNCWVLVRDVQPPVI